jgi:hypothetical protein
MLRQSCRVSFTSGSLTAQSTIPLPCSWDEVLDSIYVAKSEYEGKTSSQILRAIPRNSVLVGALRSLADMIPDQDGLSVMRGGMKYIFEVQNFRQP